MRERDRQREDLEPLAVVDLKLAQPDLLGPVAVKLDDQIQRLRDTTIHTHTTQHTHLSPKPTARRRADLNPKP